jgi:hypothetical protein
MKYIGSEYLPKKLIIPIFFNDTLKLEIIIANTPKT